MTGDRRLLRSNGRVAHVSLRGQVEAERFAEGTWCQVSGGKVPILTAPDGVRDRELLYGEPFCVLERGETHSFGFAQRDGYVGYVANDCLFDTVRQPTHRVAVARSYLKATPEVKAYEPVFDLSFGSFVEVMGQTGDWAEVGIRLHAEPGKVFVNHMPACHLAPLRPFMDDPVAVAALFLGTPYLWGGNSAFGIDCSGLVQAALLACGIPCPGDSDLQEAALGETLTRDAAPGRGDLLFWKGHVAMVADEATLIHANAYHMAVAYEGIDAAIARIESQGGGPVTRRARIA